LRLENDGLEEKGNVGLVEEVDRRVLRNGIRREEEKGRIDRWHRGKGFRFESRLLNHRSEVCDRLGGRRDVNSIE